MAKQGASVSQDWGAGVKNTGGAARVFFPGAAALWRKEENPLVMPARCGS